MSFNSFFNDSTLSDILTCSLFACDADLLSRRQRCAIEVDDDVACFIVDHRLVKPLTLILGHAIDHSDEGTEISITVVSGDKGLEIEIAEATPDVGVIRSLQDLDIIPLRVHQARQDLDDLECSLEIANCPQGGKAYTIHCRAEKVRAVA